jgi:hypothetical protein
MHLIDILDGFLGRDSHTHGQRVIGPVLPMHRFSLGDIQAK